MDADMLSKARTAIDAAQRRAGEEWAQEPARLRHVTGRYPGTTVEAPRYGLFAAVPALAECAAALVDLMSGLDDGDGLVWWCFYAEDGDDFRCLGCGGSASDSRRIRHEEACPAMRADAAIRRLAGEVQP
jgi:hypothetical protein